MVCSGGVVIAPEAVSIRSVMKATRGLVGAGDELVNRGLYLRKLSKKT